MVAQVESQVGHPHNPSPSNSPRGKPAALRLENAMRNMRGGQGAMRMTTTMIEMSVMAVMEDIWCTCEEMNLLEGEQVSPY